MASSSYEGSIVDGKVVISRAGQVVNCMFSQQYPHHPFTNGIRVEFFPSQTPLSNGRVDTITDEINQMVAIHADRQVSYIPSSTGGYDWRLAVSYPCEISRGAKLTAIQLLTVVQLISDVIFVWVYDVKKNNGCDDETIM